MSKSSASGRPRSGGGSGKRRTPAARRKSGGFPLVGVIIGVGAVAVVLGLVVSLSRQLVDIEGVQSFGSPARDHVASATYTENPPVGGPHSAAWQNCGIYDQPVQSANAVHSLEHGAVWITYRPDLGAEGVEQLRSLVRGKSYTLLSPLPELTAPVGISAWGVNLTVDSPSDPRLEQFINKYRNGPQTPEPGASCSGGIGRPIER